MENYPIVVITYHNVVKSNENLYLYDISFQELKKQMEYIRDTPCTVRNTNVIITFDDGFSSWSREVLDLLKQYDLKAYFFVCIESLNRGIISKDDIIKLHKNGMIIGSHGVTHNFLRIMPDERIYNELKNSKKILENIINDEVTNFSVPRGLYDERVIKIAREVGYRYIFASDYGINNGLNLIVKRVPIKRHTTFAEFKKMVNGKFDKKQLFVQILKDAAKNILGIRNYNRIRNLLILRAEYE